MLASRTKRMEALDELRRKLPPKAIKDRYGVEITRRVRDPRAPPLELFKSVVRMAHHLPKFGAPQRSSLT